MKSKWQRKIEMYIICMAAIQKLAVNGAICSMLFQTSPPSLCHSTF